MGCLTASRLNLSQCLEIQVNGYRSRDAKRDYQVEEVEARILKLQANKDARHLKLLSRMEAHLPPFFDEDDFKEIEVILPPTPEEEGIIDEVLPPLFHGEEFYTNDNGSLVCIPSTIMEF